MCQNNDSSMFYNLEFDEDARLLSAELQAAQIECDELETRISESKESINALTLDCDKTDYILAISSGVLCGLLDVFLVGKPGETPVGDITDKWFEERVIGFAELLDEDGKTDGSLSSAIGFLEGKFKIPYDQSTVHGAAKEVFGLTPCNHHFKSLAHNPSLLGLFFSILDQFDNTSHFISDGLLLSMENAKEGFELRGNNVPSKLVAGIVNWIGHILSDVSGASTTKGRGMGIPSPLWTWMNDIIAVKNTLKIPVTEFDKSFNNLAMKLFTKGYDSRFQVSQAVPVFVNEVIVRMFYSVRRMIRFLSDNQRETVSFDSLWNACEPFSNATVKRMLTVAHGTFCLVDIGDATIRGISTGGVGVVDSVMRVNVVGIGRFTVSLYGEMDRNLQKISAKKDLVFLLRDKQIVDYYIDGLKCIADVYDDRYLMTFVDDFSRSDAYAIGFMKTAEFANKRGVNQEEVLRDKADIDNYFQGGQS